MDIVKRWCQSVLASFGVGNPEKRLARAASNGCTRVVKALLRTGFAGEVNLALALQAAAEGGYSTTVQALLDGGADLHAGGGLAPWCTAEYGHATTTKALLDAGADVHARDEAALRSAMWGGHTHALRVLHAHASRPRRSRPHRQTLV